MASLSMVLNSLSAGLSGLMVLSA